MAWPDLHVEVDFVNDPLTPLAGNTWTDITAYVLSFTTRRGRSDELSRVEAGVATIVLDNNDRRFDPTNTTGPYYGDLVPMRKLRIYAIYTGLTYYLFTGFVESWPQVWPGGLDATAPIDVVDAFKVFALARLNGPFSNEFTNWSVDTGLDAVSWPVADRVLSLAQSQTQPGTWNNTPALTHFQNMRDVESGLFFMSGTGRAHFQDRHYRYITSASMNSQATFSDAVGHVQPWDSLTSKYDDTYIWNEARVTRTGGVEQLATDVSSQITYFTRTLVKELPILTDGEALSLAQWMIIQYANPIFRITSMTINCGSSDSLWGVTFARNLSDRITVIATPPGASGTITQECYVEGVAHVVDHDSWRVTFQLSPAPVAASGGTYWILQDAVYGVLNSTTRLAY